MPCWNLLGLEICLPSLDDIVNAVVAPITNFVTSSLSGLIDTLSPYFDMVTNTLSPLFQTVIDAITTFLTDPLASIQTVLGSVSGVVSGLWDQINGGLSSLWTSISGTLTNLGAQITTGLSELLGSINASLASLGGSIEAHLYSSLEGLNDTLMRAGVTISGALETTQTVLMTAFDGMGNALSGVIGGVFSGFGAVDVDGVLGAHANIWAILETAIQTLGLTHSPITPDEAAAWTPGFVTQVSGAVTTLHITNVIAESVSLGQIDVSLSEAWKYPNTAAALELATEFVAMPLREGLGPAYKRHILSTFQPNIPPYMDLISIYVKEGYLEDHWLELPAEMVQNFTELGYSEYWTKRLWGKHWEYPSPTQLYEMLHRTAGNFPEIGVTSETLRNMLKLHDFEPKWRGPLEAISWGTWRIYDIRTGWEMGLLSDGDLTKRLIDTGYEPRDAALLAEIQKMFVLRSEIDRILTEADQDFIEGWIDESQLKADYEATPYNPFVIDLRIARVKLRRDRDLKRDIKTALVNRYKKADLSAAEFKLALSQLGVDEAWIATELEKADATILKKVYEDTTVETKGLTEAKYSRAYHVGLITETVYRAHLAALKYGSGDISLLVELNTPEKPTPEEIKQLTTSELKAAFRVEVLSESELRAELAERRYSPEDIKTIVETEKKKIKPIVAG